MDLKRLCHISDLPNSLHFLPTELKHLLPIHYSRFIDNVTTILSNQAQNMSWPIYPDHELLLGTSKYAQVTGGWCEDIDGQQMHLKSSLELTTIILNYIQSALLQQVSEKQSQISTVQKIQHFLGNSRVNSSIEGLAVGVSAMAYNIYRIAGKQGKTRLIFVLGRQPTGGLKLFSLGTTIRGWNITRLKCQQCLPLQVNRCHKLIEHVLMITRGFMNLAEEDHRCKKQQLIDIIDSIDPSEDNPVLNRGDLQSDYVLMFSRFEYHYKEKLQQKQLMLFSSTILLQLLAFMPINVSCSFMGRPVHNQKLNEVIVLWLTTYKPPSGQKPVKLADSSILAKAAVKGMQFLRKKQLESIKDPSVNLADQILKSSLRVLSRYKPTEDQQLIAGASAHVQSRNQSFFEDRHKFDFDRFSGISKISFKNAQQHDRITYNKKQLSGSSLEISRIGSEGRGNYESLTSPLMLHRDREYAEVLKTVDEWQSTKGKIIPSNQLKTKLRLNCQNAKQRYGKSSLSKEESYLLLALVALQYYLNSGEIVLMLENYADHRQSIFQIMFQRSKAETILQMGLKIAKDCGQSLYESYLTKQFRIDRNNLIVGFLKKYLSLYTVGARLPDLSDKILVPVLLDLLESRQYRNDKYRVFIKPLLGEIFAETEQLKLIAPILHELYSLLSADHHEELINGLVADLAYECIYYYFDSTSINNSPYRYDTNLKQKKVRQMLREGGFNSLGFDLKTSLKPLILTHAHYSLPSSKIYDQIVITRPSHITRFIELLLQSQFTQQYSDLGKFFRSMERVAAGITRPVGNVYLKNEARRFKFEREANEPIQLNGAKSQSGIFKELLAYNPQIKIAGMSLSQVMKGREQDDRSGSSIQKYSIEYILNTVLTLNLEETYEFIRIAGNLKQKYEQYQLLKEDERTYLKEIVQQVLCRKASIYEYLQIDRLVKSCDRAQVAYLF